MQNSIQFISINICSWIQYEKDSAEHLGVFPGKIYMVPDLLHFIIGEDTQPPSPKEACDKYKMREGISHYYGKQSYAPSGQLGEGFRSETTQSFSHQ